MNKVILIGRLVAEPEVKSGQSGTTIAKYRLAVNRQFKQGDHPESDFLNCVAFGKGGEFAAKHLHKGTKIAIEGRIQTGSYTKDDGSKVYTTDIIVDRHVFCEGRPSVSVGGQPSTHQENGFAAIKEDDDDLPWL